jgi:hypothetical protein
MSEEEEWVDIFDPEALAGAYEQAWDALGLTEEQREPKRRYLRDIAAAKDLAAISRFGAWVEGIALDMELATDMALDAEREIREITGVPKAPGPEPEQTEER